MELLQTALVITLLTITSAKPMYHRDHHDADIADKDWTQGLQDQNNWWLYQLRGYNSHDDDSSESSETESSESSEEIVVVQTTAPETTAAVTTAVMEDGSTIAPEPDTIATDGPIAMETTQQPGTPTVPVDATSLCVGGQCVIYEIPTEDPNANRGDN